MGFSLGGLIGGIAKVAGSVLPGPFNLPAKIVGGLLAPSKPAPAPTVVSYQGAPLNLFGPQSPTAAAPMATTTIPFAQNQPAACPTGFRLNKSTYVTRGGGTSRWPQQLQVHEKKTVCVKRRKINAGNGKAARRAVSRLVSFYRLSNRVARQLQKAARGAKLGRGRRRMLPAGRGSVQVIDTD
jgi:hypothetical protein